jgi:catechol 2,3-dioxygenase-like lactoylglutathione lyase family enzyme
MLSDFPAVAVLAVADLERARQFYEGVLGFTPQGDAIEGVMYGAGGTTFLVYPSSYAGTNQATGISFQVAEASFDAEIARLRDGGVEFQTFDMEGLTWSGGVADMGEGRAVWFADPDGNVLNVETHREAG